MKFLALYLVLALLLTACPPTPSPPPVDEGDGGAPCAVACQHLRDIGCSDGYGVDGGASCEDTCDRVQSSHLTDFHLGCLAGARTTTAAVACGSVLCR